MIGLARSSMQYNAVEKDDDALRLKLTSILPINIGSLLFSILGLMMVVMGVLLG